ncbi:MAG: hypothetical protein GXP63_03360 [DPANN group archaeon]|nr:hypothetical protein [DPANN group archaeon]
MIPSKEISRQLVHLLVGVGFCILYLVDVLTVPFMVIFTGAGILIYYLNKEYPLKILEPFLAALERDADRKRAPGKGALTLIIGITLSMILFPKDIALAAIIILALGDSVSPLIGHYGRISHPLSRDKEKMLEGTIAGFVVGYMGAQFFVSPFEAFIASAFAMLFEALEVRIYKTMDDNIVMPLVAGGILMLLRLL